MRAHFAGDVATAEAPTDADRIDKIETETEAEVEAESEPLNARIDEFKQDTKNMEVVSEFIDDVLQKAEEEAVKQQGGTKDDKNSQQPKEKTRQSFTILDFKNGKMVNRARGLVVRIFDAICNCANTAAGPAQRIKLRAKRAASAATAAAEAEATENGTEAKKQDVNGKEKKGDKKQKDKAAKDGGKEENGAAKANTSNTEEETKGKGEEVAEIVEGDKKEKQQVEGDKAK